MVATRLLPPRLRSGRPSLLHCVASILFFGSSGGCRAEQLLGNPGFENGVEGWYGFGTGEISAQTSVFRSGSAAARVSGRQKTWHGIAVRMASVLTDGRSYRISAWFRLGRGLLNEQLFYCILLLLGVAEPGGKSRVRTGPRRMVLLLLRHHLRRRRSGDEWIGGGAGERQNHGVRGHRE